VAALSAEERRSRRDELDAVVSSWTASRSPADAEATLIAAGVPAHSVQNSAECADDVQLAHERHFVTLPHPEHGTIVVEGSRATLSDTPAVVAGIPPLLGQDTVAVLTEVLGYDDDRLAILFAAGAIN
jgi:crotonobetainyl-CoA:carnitine CoA-transferase CaiB-like acyl-CoA transferase